MSERDSNGYDIEQQRKARRTIAQAIGEYADAHEITEGGICTGYVIVMEITLADGRSCFWMAGDGADPEEDDLAGLNSWRVEGLIRSVIRDLYSENTSTS